MKIEKFKGRSLLTAQNFYLVLLSLIWTKDTVWAYIVLIIGRLPYIGSFYQMVYPTMIAFALVFSLPHILEKCRGGDVLFYIGALLLVLLSYMIHPNTQIFVESYLIEIMMFFIPMYFVGLCCSYEECKRTLFCSSVIGCIIRFSFHVYYAYTGAIDQVYNMSASYKVLPAVMFMLIYAINTRKLQHWLIAIAGVTGVFSYGTRGPVLAIVVFLIIGSYTLVVYSKKKLFYVLYILLSVLSIKVVTSENIMIKFAEKLSDLFNRYGFSTRLFDFFISGNIMESNSRTVLKEKTLDAISENPFWGYGIMGDRVVLGTYCHNIFLELLCDFGVVLGTLFIVALVAIIFIAIRKTWKTEYFFFVSGMIIAVVVKLMFSNSYIVEPDFFFMLGISIAASRNTVPKEVRVL